MVFNRIFWSLPCARDGYFEPDRMGRDARENRVQIGLVGNVDLVGGFSRRIDDAVYTRSPLISRFMRRFASRAFSSTDVVVRIQAGSS